jgi:hypothetical protein
MVVAHDRVHYSFSFGHPSIDMASWFPLRRQLGQRSQLGQRTGSVANSTKELTHCRLDQRTGSIANMLLDTQRFIDVAGLQVRVPDPGPDA